MKKLLTILVSVTSLLIFSATAFAEKAPQSVIDIANTKLAEVGSNPVLVKAVKAQNSQGKTLDQIKEQDEHWKATAGVDEHMQEMMDSECSKHLRTLLDSNEYYAEIFVMDNKGANVCMTDKTSDYWQGDEAKFQKSYAGGSGAVFVDDVEFDPSTQAYLVQVSVPVKDNGNVVGAITFGIDVDKVN